MKAYHFGSSALVTAILFFAWRGNAQTIENPNPCTALVTAKGPAQLAGFSPPANVTYRWSTLFIDEPAQPGFSGIVVNADGNVLAIKGSMIVRIEPDGKMIPFAGARDASGSEDGVGPAARFNAPHSLALDRSGNLYVSDPNNHNIRKVTPAGVVTTFAGSAGLPGNVDGIGTDARFYHPRGIGVDGRGNLYVGDECNNTIRRITPDGVVSTIAGQAPGEKGSSNDPGKACGRPGAFAVDGRGNVYYVQHGSHAIRKVTPEGMIATIGGVHEKLAPIAEGPGDGAQFRKPVGLASDMQGNIYVVTDLSTVCKMSADGEMSIIGRNPDGEDGEDTAESAARFEKARGVAVSSAGVVYVACSDRIIRGTPIQ
jgi:streptogramin lyase